MSIECMKTYRILKILTNTLSSSGGGGLRSGRRILGPILVPKSGPKLLCFRFFGVHFWANFKPLLDHFGDHFGGPF